MITIIHGEDSAKSREYFFALKQKLQNAQSFDGEKILLADLIQATQGQGLFDDHTAVFIEGLFAKRKPGKELSAITEYLSRQEKNLTVYLWESKTLTPKVLNTLGKPAIHAFEFPKAIFAFLDAILPGNGQKSARLLQQVLQTEEIEFVFFMIVRLIRILLCVVDQKESSGPIDEVKRLPSWQRNKLEKQANVFGKETLLKMFNDLFRLEAQAKTGQLPISLRESVDFFLASL